MDFNENREGESSKVEWLKEMIWRYEEIGRGRE